MTPEARHRIVRSGTSTALTLVLCIPLGMVAALHQLSVALAAIACSVAVGAAAAVVAAVMAPTPALRGQAKRKLMWVPCVATVVSWGGLRVLAGPSFDLVAIALGASILVGFIVGIE